LCYDNQMATVYLALGSNLGNSYTNIDKAIALLSKSISHLKRAPLYISKAIGYTDQPDFLNTAITGMTSLSPIELLNFNKAIEKKVGRIDRFRWGPREIDIDIIFYDDLVLDTSQLKIPHSQFMNRDFVLQPIVDLNPSVIDPVSKLSVDSILNQLNNNHKSALKRLT
jgi:2-amino-4-hydroxy-6-hydroxymethyldihydropteridine diphosphokinase